MKAIFPLLIIIFFCTSCKVKQGIVSAPVESPKIEKSAPLKTADAEAPAAPKPSVESNSVERISRLLKQKVTPKSISFLVK